MIPMPLRANSISTNWSNAREQELNKLKQEVSQQNKTVNSANKSNANSIEANKESSLFKSSILEREKIEQSHLPQDKIPQELVKDKQNSSEESGADASIRLAEIEAKLAKLEAERQQVIAKLSSRDTEVRQHEEAHVRVGQELAGTPQYETVTGPDGKSYIVNGEVPIDVSSEKDPERTMQKMQKVMRAALAPAEPSPADRQVYAIAQANYNEARVVKKQLDDQINRENLEKAKLLASQRAQANDEYAAKNNKLSKMAFEESIDSLKPEDKKTSFPFAKKRNQAIAVLQKLELFGNKNPTRQETVQNFFNWSSGLKLPESYNMGQNLDMAA